jgi:XapX domain-containing protein
MKIAIGFVLALAIGVLCRVASVPLPAPPVVIGALLVVAMTVGYVLADRFAQHRQARHRSSCGGPLGYSASDARNVT